MKFKRYPKYKDSGVEWLGEIPAYWDVLKLKHIAATAFSNVDKYTIDGENPVRLCNYMDVYHNDYITPDLNFMGATATLAEIMKFKLRKGDVIVTKDSETWNDIAIPAFVSTDLNDVVCGYHLALIRPNTGLIDGEYLYRAFCSRGLNDQFRAVATGITRFGLGKYWIDNALFVVPPIEEQRAIANFLDRETAKIDELVAKKERLIELLQEKRTALITRAVTKGLDPNVPMKESGVEWLGEIPTQWQVLKMKRISTITYGVSLELDRTLRCGIKIISLPNISIEGELDLHNVPFTSMAPEELEKLRLKRGDLLFNWRSGSSDHVGKTALFNSDDEYTHVSFLLRIRFSTDGFIPSFYQSYRNSLRFTGFFKAIKAGVNNTFNQSELSELETVLPPRTEQLVISEFISRETRKIDELAEKIQKGIEQLKEYRTALISAAVTGKIDVREEVA